MAAAILLGTGPAAIAQSPGNVDGLQFWLDATQLSGSPNLVDPAFNYNPAINYDGTYADNYDITRTFQTVFIVSLLEGDASPISPALSIATSSGQRMIRIESNTNWYYPSAPIIPPPVDKDFSSNLQTIGVGTNGSTGFQYPHILLAQSVGPFSSFNGFWVAGGFSQPNTVGLIAEIIAYEDLLTSDEQARVLSYLALKYGIELNSNYVNASGTIIWNKSTNTGYNSRIAGIGRDDLGQLYQRQSVGTPEENLSIAAGSLAATNAANSASLPDQAFMIWGHNGGDLSDFTALGSAVSGLTHRSDKVWKVANASLNQSIQMRFDISGFGTCYTPNKLRLLVDDASDFSTPTVYTPSSSNASEVFFDLPAAIANNHYFTLAYPLAPDLPTIAATSTICNGSSTTLQITGGNLNEADEWVWYEGSCGGTQIGTGNSISVMPNTTTTYYVRGEGACITTPGACRMVTQEVFVPEAIAGPDQPLCEESNTSVIATPPAYPGQWTKISGPGNIVSPFSATTQITGLVPGQSTTLRWTITASPTCLNSDDLVIFNDEHPNADAGTDQVVCGSTSTSMTALDPSPGAGIWTLASGGGVIADPSAPNSLILNLVPGTSATFRWTVASANGGCPPALDEVAIAADVDINAAAGPDQIFCGQLTAAMAANDPAPGTGLWTVVSGTANIVSPNSPATQITGLIPGQNVTLRWRVSSPGNICIESDEMTIFNNIQPVANAGPDQNLCEQSSTVLAANNPGTGLGVWEIISGVASIPNLFSPTTSVTNLVPGIPVTLRWTVSSSSGGCEASDEMVIRNDALPVLDAGPDQFLCDQTTTQLQAADPLFGSGAWSVVSGNASIVSPNSPMSALTNIAIGNNVLRWTVTGPLGNCIQSDNVTINNSGQLLANAGPDQALCNQTSTLLAAAAPVTGSGAWTVRSGTATITNPTNPNSQVTGLVPGQNVTLRWTITSTSGACSGFDEMMIVNEIQPIANAGPDQHICFEGSTQLSANVPASGAGQWTLVSGSATIDDPSAPNTFLFNLIPGQNVTLRWTVTSASGFCTAFDEMTIVNENIPNANAGFDIYLCDLTTTQMQAVLPPGTSGQWTVVFGSTNIVSPTSPTTTITGLNPPDDVVLRWTITSPSGLCSRSDEVNIFTFISPIANAGPDQILCAATSTVMAANPGGQWSVVSGTVIIADEFDPNTSVSGLIPGSTVTLRWTVTGDPCSATDQIVITNELLPVANAGPDQNLCNQTSTTLNANTPAAGSGQWSVISGVANIQNPASAGTAVNGLLPGQNVTLRWTVTSASGVCSGSDEIVIVNEPAPIANAGADQALCNTGIAQLSAQVPLSGSGLWSLVSGTANIDAPSQANSTVSGLIPGQSVTLRWMVTNASGFCTAFDEVTLTNEIAPSIEAGPDQYLCDQSGTQMQATLPGGATGVWSLVQGVANIVNPASPLTAITGLPLPGSVILRWTVTAASGVCVRFDELTVSNYVSPVANAGPDQTLCGVSSTTLQGNNPSPFGGLWSVISGSATIVEPSSPTTQITNLVPGTNVRLRWFITGDPCPASDEVLITNEILPIANAGPDQNICNQTSVVISATPPTAGSGQWSVINGAANISNPASATTQLTGLIPGQNVTVRWTVTSASGICVVFDEKTIVNDLQPVANAGPNQVLCQQTQTTLNATVPGSGTGTWSIILGTAIIVSPNSPSSTLTNLIPGQNVALRWTVNSPSGACLATDDVLIFNDIQPVANAGADQNVCNQTSVQLQATNPASGAGVWSVLSGTANIVNSAAPNSLLNGLIPGQNITLRWTVTSENGACSASDEVTIHNDQLQLASAGPDQQLCNQTSAALQGDSPVSGSGLWTIISGPGSIATPTAPNTTISNLAPGQNTRLRWTITGPGGICQSSDEVLLINDLPVTANAGQDQWLCNQTSTQLEGNVPVTGSGIWSIISGTGVVSAPAVAVSQINNLIPGQSVTLRWTVTGPAGVCNASDIVLINNDIQVSASAGPDQLLCNQVSAQLAATAPLNGVGVWGIVSGTGTVAQPNSNISQVTGLIPGQTVTLRWTVTGINGICIAEDDMVIVNDVTPSANAGADQTLCSQSSTQMAATPANNNETGAWSVVSGNANITSINAPATQVTGLIPGQTVTLRWTVRSANQACLAFDEVIIVNDQQTSANAGPNQTLCNKNDTQLQAFPPSSGSGLWSVISGTANIINPNAPNSTVTGLVPGQTAVLRWTVSSAAGACSSQDEMQITNDLQPIANAGPNLEVCNQTSIPLQAIPASGGSSGLWSVVSGSANFAAPTTPNTSISGLPVGQQAVLRWTVTSVTGVCVASDDMSVSNDAQPVANAGTDQTLCNVFSATLTANPASIGIGSWSIINGTGTFNNVNNPNAQVSGLSAGETTLRWTVNPQNACAASTAEISIFVNDPAPGIVGNSPLCAGQELVLTVDGNNLAQVNWSGPAGFTSNNPYISILNAQPANAGNYSVTVSQSNGCTETAVFQVDIDPIPVVQAGPDQLLCNQTSTQMNATSSTGTGNWTLVSGNATIDDPNLPNTTISGLQNGATVVLRWTANSTGGSFCTASDEVQIAVSNAGGVQAGPDQSVCYNTAVTLNASIGAGNTGVWSVVSGTGIFANPNAPNTGVTGLSNGPNTFRWTVTGSGCGTGIDDVILTLAPAPGVPDAGADQTVCGTTTAQLAAIPPTNGQGFWQLVSGTGVIVNPNVPNTTVTGLTSGQSSVFRWNIQNGANCPVLSDLVIVSVGNTPPPANAGADQQVCYVGNTTLNAVPPGANASGVWSVVSGSATIANPSAYNSNVTGLPNGLTVLRWTVNTPGCPSSSADLSLTVIASPGQAQAGPDQSFCALTTTQMAAVPVTAGQGVWQLISGTALIANPGLPNTTVSGLVPGQTAVLQWNTSNGICPVLSDQVSISVIADPQAANAGVDQSICYLNTATLGATAVPGTGIWSVVSGTAVFGNPNAPNSSVSGLSSGVNTLRWTVSNGAGCPVTTDEANIVVTASPGIPDAGPDQVLCGNSATTLAAVTPISGQGFWQIINGSATLANANDPQSAISGINIGQTVQLQWNIRNGSCPVLSDQVNISAITGPQIANAGTDQSLCYVNNTTLNASPSANGAWSIITGTGSFSNANAANSNVSSLALGLNVFQWTVNNGANCPSTTDQVAIFVNASPGTPDAGADQILCAVTSTQLAAQTPLAGQGVWQIVSGPGTIANADDPASLLNNLQAGQTTVLRWSINNGSCPSLSDLVSIRVNSDPQVANAGQDQAICYTPSASLNAIPVPGTGFWVLAAGNATIANPNDPKTSVTNLSNGINTLRWVVDNGNGCPVTTDEVNIVVTQSPGLPNAGPDQILCNASSVQLNATPPDAGQGFWELISGPASITALNDPKTAVTGLIAGQVAILQWNISNGSCPVLSDRVTISVLSDPQAANAGADQTLCYDGNTVLNAAPVPGMGTWSVVSGSAVFANANANNSSVSGLADGLNILLWTVNNGAGCPLTSDEVRINVTPSPGTPSAGPDISVCNATSTQMAATLPTNGQGFWELASGTATIIDQNNPNSLVVNLIPGQNAVLRWVVRNGNCPALSDDVMIRVNLPQPADAGADQKLCYTDRAILNAAQATGTWSVVLGTANFANPNTPNTLVTGLSAGLNVLQWSVQNVSGCPPVTDQVIVEYVPSPGTPNAGPDQALCLITSTALNAVPISTGQGIWSVIQGAGNVANPSQASTTVTDLIPGQTTLLSWSVYNGSCPFIRDTLAIQILGDPLPAYAGDDQQLCYVFSTQMTANPTNGTGTWSLISGAGTIANPNNPNTMVSGLDNGVNTFQWTINYGAGCVTVGDQITLNVTPSPGTANAGPDQLVCNGSQTQLAATTPLTGTGIWKLVAGTANIANPALPNTIVDGLVPGDRVTLRWEIQNGACPVLSDEMVILIQPPVVPANAGPDKYVCYSNSAAMGAAAAQQGSGRWSVVSGAATFANASDPLTLATGFAPGINVLRWTVNYINGCNTTFDEVTVEFVPPPSAPNAGPDQNLCGVTATQLAAVVPVVGTGNWRLISGTATIADPTNPASPISGIVLGSPAVFSWAVSNGICPIFGSDEVTVSVINGNIQANAGSDRSVCGGDTIRLNAALPSGTGLWSVVSGAGTFENPANPRSAVSGLANGDNILRWTLSPGLGCAPTTDEVRIYYTPASAANAGPDQSLCALTTAQLQGNSPILGNGQWILLSGTATISTPNAPSTSLSGLVPGNTVTLRWTVTNGVCPPASDTIRIVNALPPSTANAGADFRVCETTPAQLAATAPSVGTGRWSVVSGSGTIANPVIPNSAINGLTPGATTTLRWTVSNGACPVSTDDVTVTSDRAPAAANAGPDATLCALTQYTLQGNAPAVGSGLWSIVSGSGTIASPANPVSAVSGLAPGATTTLRWTISNGACPVSTDQISIKIDQNPLAANAGPDLKVCDNEVKLGATPPTIGTGAWTILSGTGQLNNVSDPATLLSGLTPPGTVLLRWTVRNGVCPVVGDDLQVTVNVNTLNPQAGPDQTLCDAAQTSVRAQNPPAGATGQWSVIKGNATLGNANSPLTTVSNLSGGTQVVLLWTLVNNTCPPVSDTLVINNGNSNALNVNFLVSETACTNDTIHIIEVSDTLTSFNLSYRWEFGDGAISTERDPVHIYPNPGMYGIRLITQAGSCVYLSLVKTINILPCRPVERPGNRTFLFGQVTPTLTNGPISLFLKLNRTDQPISIRVLTIDGRVYESRSPEATPEMTEHFDLLEAGLYFVEVVAGNRERMVFRVARIE